MGDKKGLIDICTDLIRLVEGVGCKDWRDENGKRFKDTQEWVHAYVAINNARSEARKATATPPADAALIGKLRHQLAQVTEECAALRARQPAKAGAALTDDIYKAVYASNGVRLRLLRDADYLEDNGYIMRAANSREAAALIERLAARQPAQAVADDMHAFNLFVALKYAVKQVPELASVPGIRDSLAEYEALKPDEAAKVLRAYEDAFRDTWRGSELLPALAAGAAALEAVPVRLTEDHIGSEEAYPYSYMRGWNDCLDAMLSKKEKTNDA